MNPKMTAQDAASCLGTTKAGVLKVLQERGLPFCKINNTVYFGHHASQSLFHINQKPQVIAFQIVKGGTGKTSLAHEFAVRAYLYGAKVLCIDLDQQGNLTQAFDEHAEDVPVMVDVLAEGYPLKEAIIEIYPGLDLIGSRIENAILDDVIKAKKLKLDQAYHNLWKPLRQHYDLIVIDCPPNLGQSVAAATLAADRVISPVTPEKFSMAGLKATNDALQEIESAYSKQIAFNIVMNKFDKRTGLSQDALGALKAHPNYQKKLLDSVVRLSQEFPNAVSQNTSIYDAIKANIAKTDIDQLTREILGIQSGVTTTKKRRSATRARFDATLA